MEPFITPDGKRIYFNAGDIRNTDLWYCERNTETWSVPTQLPASINTAIYEWYPSVSQEDTIFFARDGDLYYSPFQNGQYSQAEKLGTPVNTSQYAEADPYIAPQEEYLIFHSVDRPGGFGQADLYISYKKANGQWTNPKNMGPTINTAEFECGPSVSQDGKYLLFTRREKWLTDKPSKVYWISADIIARLKHTNFTPYVSQPLAPQTGAENQQFTFTVPDTTFVDDDGNHTLTYTAVLATGAAWPAWLHFDPATRTLSGIPTEKGTAGIKISATDTAGATTSTPFHYPDYKSFSAVSIGAKATAGAGRPRRPHGLDRVDTHRAAFRVRDSRRRRRLGPPRVAAVAAQNGNRRSRTRVRLKR